MITSFDETFDWEQEVKIAMTDLEKEEKVSGQQRSDGKAYCCDYCSFYSSTVNEIENHIIGNHSEMIFGDHGSSNDDDRNYPNLKDFSKHEVTVECLSEETHRNSKNEHERSSDLIKNKNQQIPLKKHETQTFTPKYYGIHEKQNFDVINTNIEVIRTQEQTFKCKFDNCNDVFVSKELLQVHSAYKHNGLACVNCPYCNLSTKHFCNLIRHINRMHTKAVQYKCKLCTYARFARHEVKKHLETFHEICPSQPEVEKNNSDKQNSDKKDNTLITTNDRDIKRNHGRLKYYKCTSSFCNYFAYGSTVVSKHYKAEHIKNGVDNKRTYEYKCNLCRYSPLRMSDMKRHLKRVHKKAGNLFQTQPKNQTLPREINIKTIANPTCNVLKKKEIKTYPCMSCKGLYVTKSLLLIHQASFHLKLRLGKCVIEMCSFSLSFKESPKRQGIALSKHIMDEHKPRVEYRYTYYCELCTFSAATLRGTRSHLSTSHQMKPNIKVKDISDGVNTKLASLNIGSNSQNIKKEKDKRKEVLNCKKNILDISQEMSHYEILRQRNIQERLTMFNELGLKSMKSLCKE